MTPHVARWAVRRAWLALLLLGVLFGPARAAITYYVSSTGTGSTCSSASPCAPASVWTLLVAGDTVIFNNGTYQGANYMIQPTSGLSGSSGNPITIQAETEGSVTIDGQGVRIPVDLSSNAWFVLQGFNAKDSSETVVAVHTGSDNTQIKRVVAWDAKDTPNTTNFHIFQISGSTGVLLEDVAAFGKARKLYEPIVSGSVTFRRIWGRRGGYASTASTPRTGIELHYEDTGTVLVENAVITWSEEDATDPGGGDGMIANTGAESTNYVVKVLGSLGYLLCSATRFDASHVVKWTQNSNTATLTFQDVIAFVESGCWATKVPFELRAVTGTGTATRLSAVGGTATFPIGAGWTTSGTNVAATLAGVPDPYVGAGAALCYQYQDGALTTTPLWPWAMDTRINAALSAAGRTALAGAASSWYSANTVTSEVVSILGTPPTACRTTAAGGTGPTRPAVDTRPSILDANRLSGFQGSLVSPRPPL